MRKRILFTLILVLVALSSFWLVRQMRTVGATGEAPAYLITLVEKRFSPQTGVQVYEEQILRARGATRWAQVLQRKDPAGKTVNLRSVAHYALGRQTGIDPMTESLTTHWITSGEIAALRNMERTCIGVQNAPTESIAGFETVRMVPRFAPGIILETWAAPALGCANLRERFTDEKTGITLTLREAVFVLPGEPPAALFEIPSNYQERMPSQVIAELARRYPGVRATPPETSGKLDEVYSRRQKPR